jgi:dienelactone hydrolase
VFPTKSILHILQVLVVALALLPTLAAAPALAQTRIQVIPFDTVTLSSRQVLLGETQGKSAKLAGELRLPGLGNDKVPVVVLVHGIGGLDPVHFDWINALNSWGFGVFLQDHLSGRGIAPMSPEDFLLPGASRLVDIYQALASLLKHPRVAPQRIAIMGFSMGGYVTLLSTQERFRRVYGPPGFRFAAHLAVYPAGCNVRLRDDLRVTDRPIRLFHGTADDWTPVEPCRLLVADLKKAGADAALTEYPGAAHGYDNPAVKARFNFPQAPSLRKCSLIEGEAGQVLNARTGQPFTTGDPCIEWGTSLQYDEAATAATREAVRAVLAAAFAAKSAAAVPSD